MAIVVVEAVAPVASWRPPEALTYHRTLPLPPVHRTGRDPRGRPGLRLARGLSVRRRAGDTTRCRRLARGPGPRPLEVPEARVHRRGEEGIKTDVLLRELWIDVRLALVVEAPDLPTAEAVADAFRRPSFP